LKLNLDKLDDMGPALPWKAALPVNKRDLVKRSGHQEKASDM
jgi:hypothetical protein